MIAAASSKKHGSGDAVDAVQWSRPWYHPWRALGRRVEHQLASGRMPWEALNQAGPAPVRFVPHSDLPAGIPYEQFIRQSRTCPTRLGLHDFFNGLCWITFPATKTRLNQLQAAQIALEGVRPVRGAVRDALTLFDENAAFLRAPQVLWDALAAKQWHELFVTLRPVWQDARLVVFGHALLEKLNRPRKPVSAHVYRVRSATSAIRDMDAWVAADLNNDTLACKPFAHLPVLGVPGWWQENAHAGFYQDSAVFRPARSRATE